MFISNGLGASRDWIRARNARAAWIESPAFDAYLLVFAPLSILPLVALAFWLPALAGAIAITLAFSHYASSFVFYFWDENREYHRARWIAFFAGPLFIVMIYVLLIGFKVPYIIQFLILFWNTWHVARQNCGILSIYRSRAGVADSVQKQKSAANNAIIAVSTYLTLWNVDTNSEVVALFGLVSDQMLHLVKLAAGVAAVTFTGQLAFVLLRRKDPIGIPEGLFLATSLAFFYPYLFIRTSGFATAVMLLPHYVQYLALVWLLHRRKFGATNEGAPVALRRVSGHLYLLIPILFAVGFSFHLMKDVADSNGYPDWFENLYLVIALTHFYLDGLIWSFRRPHVRQTMLPFLLRRDRPVSTLA